MIAQAYCICDGYDRCGADAGMWWKDYRNWGTNILKGQVGWNGWDKVTWLQRTLENIGECLG